MLFCQRKGCLRRATGAAAVFLFFGSGLAWGVDYYYWWEGAPSGYWDETNSWNPPTVPGAGSVAFIHSRYDGVLTPQYRSGSSPQLRAIEADRPSGTGSVNFTQARDTLKADTLTVGVYGPAGWTQSGGRAEFNLLRLGEWQPGVGTFRLQGTGELTSATTDIGSAGTGFFYLSGSGLHSAGRLWIAPGSRYKVEGGSLSADTVIVDADYLQTAGQANVAGDFKVQLGLNPPAGKADLQGGRLTAGTLSIPFGTFEQSGGELNAGTTTNGGASLCSVVGGSFTAGPVTNQGFFGQSSGTATIKSVFTNASTGTFQQSGGIWSCSSLVNQSAQMRIMNTADCRALSLNNQGTVTIQSGLLRGTEAMPGLFFICSFANAGTLVMDGGEFRGELTNNGTFEYTAGTFATSRLINYGTFTRSVPFTCGRLVNHGTLSAGAGNPITATTSAYASAIENTGTLNVSGASLTVTSGKPLVNSGQVRGEGTIAANVENSGIVTIGTSVISAILNVNGNYTQQAAGELRLTAFERIGGGATADRLAVTGAAKLGGTLVVSGLQYTPDSGDRITVMTFGSCSGSFATWTLPSLSGGLVWVRDQTSTSLALLARAAIPQDGDKDGDVDVADIDAFRACASGPGVRVGTNCSGRDFDGDGDVDMIDFARLQRCYSGPNQPTALNCAN